MKFLTLLAQILLFSLLVGLFFYSFHVELAATLSLLLLLLVAQLAFLAKRIKPTQPNRPVQTRQKPVNLADPKRAAALIKSMQAETASRQRAVVARAPAPEPERVPADQPAEIDPNVFSRFQQNLDQSAQQRAERPANKPTPAQDEPGQEVVVKLSNKPRLGAAPRNPYLPSGPPTVVEEKEREPNDDPAQVKLHENKRGKDQEDNQLLDKIPAEPLGNLFDEEAQAEAPKTAGKKIKPKPRRPQQDTKPGQGVPLESTETLDFSALEEEAKAGEADLANLQLKAAQKAFDQENYAESAKAALGWLEQDGRKSKDKTLILQFVQLASNAYIAQGQLKQDLKLWQSIFGAVVPKKDADYLPLLEERIHIYTDLGREDQAVPFLLTALSSYQTQEDWIRMDQTYETLERAYKQQGDGKALSQCYQNHLGVKKQLKDFSGQLALLDDLGKLLYDQGDQEGSKHCYEESLVVRGQMQGANSL